MSASARRVQLEAAYLLHHYAWRDSSRILELFTRTLGRVSVFARAARRGSSALPAILQPFGELLVSWTARGEAGQLTGAERARAPVALAGDRLMSAFAYAALIERLQATEQPAARALRIFEKRLLEELGWGLSLEADAASGRPLEASRAYRYRPDGGPEALDGVAEGPLVFAGASLLSLAREELDDERSLADARRLLRSALDQCLDGRTLRTREVMLAMRAHGGAQGG